MRTLFLPNTDALANLTAGDKLSVIIEPSQVRLVPNLQDGYMWVRQPEREHLFMKQLSKHSVGAYMELCREINVSIEAVAMVETNLAVCELILLHYVVIDFSRNPNFLHQESATFRN